MIRCIIYIYISHFLLKWRTTYLSRGKRKVPSFWGRGSKTFNLTTTVSHGSMVSGNLTRSLRLGFEEAFLFGCKVTLLAWDWVVQTGCIYAIIYQSYPQVTYIICISIFLCYIQALPIAYIFFFFVNINRTPWELEYRVNFFSFDIFMVSRDPGQPGQRAPGCLGHCFFYIPAGCGGISSINSTGKMLIPFGPFHHVGFSGPRHG